MSVLPPGLQRDITAAKERHQQLQAAGELLRGGNSIPVPALPSEVLGTIAAATALSLMDDTLRTGSLSDDGKVDYNQV